MTSVTAESPPSGGKLLQLILLLIAGAGFLYFIYLAASGNPKQAWLIYLVNFLFFSALAHGAMLFSTLMHFTGAKWSRALSGVAEAFSAFFPLSFVLFLILFIGQDHLFTWLGEDLHGKEVWLNVPFLFTRDLVGILILYVLGFIYLYHSLWFRLNRSQENTWLKRFLYKRWESGFADLEKVNRRMIFLAGWFMFTFAIVLSLLGFDLVMSMDAHWFSTLFGAYSFVKAIYSGFGALIIVAAILHMSSSYSFSLTGKQFRDISTLFFGFSIVWADFFYCQFLVIWYGNIPEETAYIIKRTMVQPWNIVAWVVFIGCFILPFILLLSGKLKELPQFMIVICTLVLAGFWMEHFLLLAPNYIKEAETVPIGISEVIITAGFLGLFVVSISAYLKQFPELLDIKAGEVD